MAVKLSSLCFAYLNLFTLCNSPMCWLITVCWLVTVWSKLREAKDPTQAPTAGQRGLRLVFALHLCRDAVAAT